jgi:hypothetical protein
MRQKPRRNGVENEKEIIIVVYGICDGVRGYGRMRKFQGSRRGNCFNTNGGGRADQQ